MFQATNKQAILPLTPTECFTSSACFNDKSHTMSFQLSQGTLVQVSPSLVKRRKTHFHNLPCGASIILGNNGYVWISPTVNEDTENTGGFIENHEVRLSMIVYIHWCWAGSFSRSEVLSSYLYLPSSFTLFLVLISSRHPIGKGNCFRSDR